MPARQTLHDNDRRFIAQQRMFFVGTAPLADDGLINVSPKGLDGSFAVIDEQTVAYLDLTGSGVETVAHLRENGRICLMFCAFEGRPNILRIQGTGEVIEPKHVDFAALSGHFPLLSGGPGVRSIIRVRVKRVADSCGFGVPIYDYVGQRDMLTAWAEKQGAEGIAAYQSKHNRQSLDGLPGLPGLPGGAGPDWRGIESLSPAFGSET